MSRLYSIKDERTVYCKVAMKANKGQWNPITREWIFRDEADHANALAELYRVTRPTAAMLEVLQAMVGDGTGALAWGFDPAEQEIMLEDLDRKEASRLLAAGYAVRRVLGVHRLEDESPAPDDVFAEPGDRSRHNAA